MKSVMVFFLAVIVAVPAFAGAPTNGTYKSTDLGGLMLQGRYTESWNPSKLMVGNTLNEASWNGAALATQWYWSCPYIVAAPALVYDGVVGGNGIRVWSVVYNGGTGWLDGAGPWQNVGDPEPSYGITIDTWAATIQETYSGGVLVGSVRTHNASGTFVGFNESCLALVISNTEMLGPFAGEMVPPNFPDFIDQNCIVTGVTGEWGDVENITFTIDSCETVGTEEATWGQVKSLYR